MNQHSDIDRVLSRWFEDGPNTMPDRVVEVVAGRIGRQPQRRTWRLLGRSTTMNTQIKLVAAAAAALVLAVAGWNLVPRNGNNGGNPTPAMSASPLPPRIPDGPVHAGAYTLRVTPGDPMAFVVSAPEGWVGFGGFFLGGPGASASGAPDGVGISVNHNPEVVVDPCDSSLHTPGAGAGHKSVDDLVAAISARSDLLVTGVTQTSLAGYSGKQLDVEFPATLACASHYLFAEPKGLYANGASNRWHVWLLDARGETAVVVLLDYVRTPAADRAAAEAAISSIRITP
jgi:hypothetical protein